MASKSYQPTPENKDQLKFTFGLWTFRNIGRDPFGDPTRPSMDIWEGLRGLAKRNVYGFNLHDNDLVPIGATAAERGALVKKTLDVMDETGIKCPMASTNLFFHPVFRDGAFTSSDPRVRAYSVQKVLQGIELAVELGAKMYIFWGGREGAEVDAAKNPGDAIKWKREAINLICAWTREQAKSDSRFDIKFGLEAKPNEPRGDIYFSTTGHMLAFIYTLDYPDMIGLNPEMGHELMAGLNFYHTLEQAKDAGKLFHVDLNSQRMLRFDEDRRFGSQGIQDCFFTVRSLENNYDGHRQFDCHPYRTETLDGAWDFVEGCMEQYLVLKEKNEIFDADPELKELLNVYASLSNPELESALASGSAEAAEKIRALDIDLDALCAVNLKKEAIDRRFNRILTGTV